MLVTFADSAGGAIYECKFGQYDGLPLAEYERTPPSAPRAVSFDRYTTSL